MRMEVAFAESEQSFDAEFKSFHSMPGSVYESAVIEIVEQYLEDHPPADGKDGKDGRDGRDGEDGYTPIKGTDYYTDADKAEMVESVLAALPVYGGEVE